MKISVKLMASLKYKLPADASNGTVVLEVDEGATILTALQKLDVEEGHVHLVLVNGGMEPNRSRTLGDGDELTVFPPVAGG